MTWIVPFDGCLFCAGPGAYFKPPQAQSTKGKVFELVCEIRDREEVIVQQGSEQKCKETLRAIIEAIEHGDPIVVVPELDFSTVKKK